MTLICGRSASRLVVCESRHGQTRNFSLDRVCVRQVGMSVLAIGGAQGGESMLGYRRRGSLLFGAVGLLLAYLVLPAVGAGAAQTTATYVVVLKGNTQEGVKAVQQAGGQVLKVNKLGIAQVSSTNPSFLSSVRGSGAVDAAANDASWHLGAKDVASVTYVPAATQAANCAAFYQVPVNVGPEPLSACE
jgi:hypothetical protein